MFGLIKFYEGFLLNLNFLQAWLLLSITLFLYLFFVADKVRYFVGGISNRGILHLIFFFFVFFPMEERLNDLIVAFNKTGMIDPAGIGGIVQFMQTYSAVLFGFAIILIGLLYFIYKKDDISIFPLHSHKWYVVGLYLVSLTALSILVPVVYNLYLPDSDDLSGLLNGFGMIGIIGLSLVLQFPLKKAKNKFWKLES